MTKQLGQLDRNPNSEVNQTSDYWGTTEGQKVVPEVQHSCIHPPTPFSFPVRVRKLSGVGKEDLGIPWFQTDLFGRSIGV